MKKFLIGSLILIAIFAVGWALTCGLIYLICICFGLKFSWTISTGIWLVLLLLKNSFSGNK